VEATLADAAGCDISLASEISSGRLSIVSVTVSLSEISVPDHSQNGYPPPFRRRSGGGLERSM